MKKYGFVKRSVKRKIGNVSNIDSTSKKKPKKGKWNQWKCNKNNFKLRCDADSSFKQFGVLAEDGSYWNCSICKNGKNYTKVDQSSITKHKKSNDHTNSMLALKMQESNNDIKSTLKKGNEIISVMFNNRPYSYVISSLQRTKLDNLFTIVFFNVITSGTQGHVQEVPLLLQALGVKESLIPHEYLKGDQLREVIICIADVILEYILGIIRESKFYSISFDKGTLVHDKLLSISLYSLYKGVLKKFFLKFYKIEASLFEDVAKFGGQEIADAVIDVLRQSKLDESCCVDVSTDRAADMIMACGLLQKRNRHFPLYIEPCYNHKLEVAMMDFLDCFLEVPKTVHDVFKHFAYSPKRISLLRSLEKEGGIYTQNDDGTLKKKYKVLSFSKILNSTRWSTVFNSIFRFNNNVFYLWEYIKKRIIQMERGETDKEEMKELLEFKKKIYTYDFLYKMKCFFDFIEEKETLTKSFQDINISVFRIHELIDRYLKTLQEMKTVYKEGSHLKQYFDEMEKTNKTLIYYSKISTRSGNEKKQIELEENIDLHDILSEFSKTVDGILSKFDELFPRKEIMKSFEFLCVEKLANLSILEDEQIREFGNLEIVKIRDYINTNETVLSISNAMLIDEWIEFKKALKKSATLKMNNKQFKVYCLHTKKKVLKKKYPNIHFMMKYVGVFIFTESGDETNFSQGGRLLDKYHASLKNNTLNAKMYIRNFKILFNGEDDNYYEKFKELILNKAQVLWLSKKKRRLFFK